MHSLLYNKSEELNLQEKSLILNLHTIESTLLKIFIRYTVIKFVKSLQYDVTFRYLYFNV